MTVLLLNPPGRRLYLRDYFCSKVSQADYVHPPIDLVFLSGWLSERFDVDLVDAVVEKLSVERCLERVRAVAPEAIVTLVGAAAAEEDLAFLERLRSEYAGTIVAVGDLVYVEEYRAGNVARFIFPTRIAVQRRHEPAGVDDPQIGLAETVRQPFRGH